MGHPTSAYQRPAHFRGLLQFPVGCGTFPTLTPTAPISLSHPLLFRFLSEHLCQPALDHDNLEISVSSTRLEYSGGQQPCFHLSIA